jgi:hypothetical protein
MIDTTGVKRLLVTGSRDWPCAKVLCAVMKACYRPEITLVVGDARGVDSSVARIWRKQGGQVDVYEAQWSVYNRRAGIVRNEAMCQSLLPERDLALAFIYNNSRGATHCLAYAQEWSIQTMVWRVSSPSSLDGPMSIPHVHAEGLTEYNSHCFSYPLRLRNVP